MCCVLCVCGGERKVHENCVRIAKQRCDNSMIFPWCSYASVAIKFNLFCTHITTHHTHNAPRFGLCRASKTRFFHCFFLFPATVSFYFWDYNGLPNSILTISFFTSTISANYHRSTHSTLIISYILRTANR